MYMDIGVSDRRYGATDVGHDGAISRCLICGYPTVLRMGVWVISGTAAKRGSSRHPG